MRGATPSSINSHPAPVKNRAVICQFFRMAQDPTTPRNNGRVSVTCESTITCRNLLPLSATLCQNWSTVMSAT